MKISTTVALFITCALSCQAQTIWNRQGVVLSATRAGDEQSVQEPTVIYEGNAQILSGNVFKMWFTSGWTSTNIGYAESLDAVHWTRLAGNVIAGYSHGFVFKSGSTYYFYGPRLQGDPFDQETSPDGVVWTKVHSAVLSPGTAGAWDDAGLDNPYVWVES